MCPMEAVNFRYFILTWPVRFFGLMTQHKIDTTELAKNGCPRLRDLATAPAGGITQSRTHFFGQLCNSGAGCVCLETSWETLRAAQNWGPFYLGQRCNNTPFFSLDVFGLDHNSGF